MNGLEHLISDDGFLVFVVLTVVMGGGAAFLSGRALASGWHSFGRAALYMVLLAAAVRFFHYALFQASLLSLHYYAVTYVVLLVGAALGYRMTRTTQMVTQYRWLYARTGPFSWKSR
jgi:hypothetical protein